MKPETLKTIVLIAAIWAIYAGISLVAQVGVKAIQAYESLEQQKIDIKRSQLIYDVCGDEGGSYKGSQLNCGYQEEGVSLL